MNELIVTDEELAKIKRNKWIEFDIEDLAVLLLNKNQAKVYTAILSKLKVKSNIATITIKEIQDKTKLSISAVYKAIRNLKDLEFIEAIDKDTYKTRNKRIKM